MNLNQSQYSCVRSAVRTLFALGLTCLVSACFLNRAASNAPPAERSLSNNFELTGRLSATDGKRPGNGRIEWEHTPTTDQWTVLAPTGQIVARLTANASGAVISYSDGKSRRAGSSSDLLPALFPGLSSQPLEPERLAAWIQAVPPPSARRQTLDRIGRPMRIVDQGWIIEYLGYRDDTPRSIPRKVEIHRGEYSLKLLIDTWESSAPGSD